MAVSGWLEESKEDLLPFIQKYYENGVQYVICTDIAKDGMLQGPSFELYQKILKEIPDVKLIASGGIAEFDDLPRLKEIGCEGAILGKAIYENKISLKQLEKFILEAANFKHSILKPNNDLEKEGHFRIDLTSHFSNLISKSC